MLDVTSLFFYRDFQSFCTNINCADSGCIVICLHFNMPKKYIKLKNGKLFNANLAISRIYHEMFLN